MFKQEATIMYNQFARNLSAIMKERSITQTQLAYALKVKQNTVSQWVSGKREPDFDTFLKICIVFNVSPHDMLGYELIKNRLAPALIRDVVGNDKNFQKEQLKISLEHKEGFGKEIEALYNKYYEDYKNRFGF